MAYDESPTYALVSRTPFYPVSYDDAVKALKLPESVPITNEEPPGLDVESDVQALIAAATRAVEGYLGYPIFTETWDQTQSGPNCRFIWLYKTPVQSIVSATYYPNWDAVSPTVVPITSYVLSGNRLAFKYTGYLPSCRDVDGFTVRYTCGALVVAAPIDPDTGYTSEEIAAAQARVLDNVKRAILQLVGHLYDNPEGRPIDIQTFSEEGKYSTLPANVVMLLSSNRDFSLTGKSTGQGWGR